MKAKLKYQKKILSSIPEILKEDFHSYEIDLSISEGSSVWLVAVGKGALKIAKKLVTQYDDHIRDGLVISQSLCFVSDKIQVFKGDHPLPSSESVASSYEVLDFVQKIPNGDTLIFCVSGGASSMFMIPPFGIEISEIQRLYKLLLRSGASIEEINIVRKHVCDVKGGKFATLIKNLKLISIIESDVPGDNLSTVGSGPSINDKSTFLEAIQILKNLKIWGDISISIQEHLIGGLDGYIPSNPKPGTGEHPNHEIELLSGSELLKKKISAKLEEGGYNVWISKNNYSGDVQKVSKQICGKAISVLSNNDELKKPIALIYQGECSVKVKGNGKGGRNQQLALMAAISLEGQHPISILSIDTDGIDGPTDAAGVIISSETTLLARKNKMDPEKILSDNNSYVFHEEMGTLVKTGITGVNYMDLQVVLID